jgi:hypothetical protein
LCLPLGLKHGQGLALTQGTGDCLGPGMPGDSPAAQAQQYRTNPDLLGRCAPGKPGFSRLSFKHWPRESGQESRFAERMNASPRVMKMDMATELEGLIVLPSTPSGALEAFVTIKNSLPRRISPGCVIVVGMGLQRRGCTF